MNFVYKCDECHKLFDDNDIRIISSHRLWELKSSLYGKVPFALLCVPCYEHMVSEFKSSD